MTAAATAPPQAAARAAVVTGHESRDALFLGFGVLCAATAGPLIALTPVPALALAFWRNALGAVAVLPLATARRHEIRTTGRRAVWLCVFAGALLAAHFATYVPSLRHTSVASASALVCSQAVWAVLFARLLGERLSRRGWLGTLMALGGVLLVTGVDISLRPETLLGNGLALAGGIFGGAYLVVGGQVRRTLSTTLYTGICYFVAAVVLLAVTLLSGQQLWGYSAQGWVGIALLTLMAQLLGHSIFTFVMRSIGATRVSLATLLTVPLAAVMAALLIGERPPAAAVPALALLLAGIAVVVTGRRPVTGALALPD